ncbi:hypothetical protein SAMN04487831_102153 [Pseudobutyrivibrio sp. UC1225]|uniref:hypothetical protein n=1 Tax=Pseudobutyrivibrio sp. UC1225 TaxID=1798185 RepID=UPI0008E0963B|nr:hypothetical protein [Pseudobutyrivibrio sp. UC1225]SFN61364.1 hypothetical protein SAMN04487831_102153 [Pseudobutyrivibrio sp. UC1225]
MNKNYKDQIVSKNNEESSKMLQMLLLQDLHSQGVVDDKLFEMASEKIMNIKPLKHPTKTVDGPPEEPFSLWIRNKQTGKVSCSECGYEPPVNQWGCYITSSHCPGCGMHVKMLKGMNII